MRKDEYERWPDEVDLDRMRAAPRSIAGGWVVVGVFAVLMLVVPPTVTKVDVALRDAGQHVAKVEQRLADAVPWSIGYCPRSG